MTVQFSTAKNGEQTCSIDGKYLHSSYNPQRESETFVSSISPSIKPSCILIIEPCLGLCCKTLRNKFPEAKIGAIRLFSDFKDFDSGFDFIFNDGHTLQDDLFNTLGEEVLCTSYFTEWQNATRILPEETKSAWNHIKNAVTKARNVLITRSHFSKRWLKNTVNFFAGIKQIHSLNKLTKPVIIACSGPSLKGSISYLKEYRNQFILIAVSSAISPLLDNHIFPDLAISTDGGYWAKKHLEISGEYLSKIPFAATPEGAYPQKLLEDCKIVPLTYEDGFETKYFSTLCKNFIQAKRNGTVSGTALQLALEWTDNDIYLCGLDQASAAGYQHTNPNKIEELNSCKDKRISTKEKRLCNSQFSSTESLEIYRQWFESFSNKSSRNIYRLSDNYHYCNSLGTIKDINWDYFKNKNYKESFESFVSDTPLPETDKTQVKKLINSIKSNGDLESELFPLETNVLEHTLNSEEKISIEQKISGQLNQLKDWLSCFESKFNI